MSLYNMVHGYSPFCGIILSVLKLQSNDFGRFRDAYFHREDDGTLTMRVHTRCGGGNRDEYSEVFDSMQKHPMFLFDVDNDFDCTYCDFVFKLPEELTPDVEKVLDATGNQLPDDKWKKVFEDLTRSAEEKKE